MIDTGSRITVRSRTTDSPWLKSLEGRTGKVIAVYPKEGAAFVDYGTTSRVTPLECLTECLTPQDFFATEPGHWGGNLAGSSSEADGDAKFADAVFQPSHYTNNIIEPITFINANGLGFNRGNVVKYTVRAGHKGGPEKELEDLQKARRYLDIEIECIERRRKVAEGSAPAEVWKEAL